MKARLLLMITLLSFFATQSVFASSHYSYEHAEELKPLIEWRDYGSAAFDEAIRDNKPVFLLLTAPSWCYWCQVYESEDYLFDPEIVEIINSAFIPIYVDADQRQDLTRQYLEGGWPSTTVMTPSGERLFGFSGVRPVANMRANLQKAVDHVSVTGFSNQVSYAYSKKSPTVPSEADLERIIDTYAETVLRFYDPVYGGFGTGQKFPQGRALDFALEMYQLTQEKQWLELVQHTLKNQYTAINELDFNYNLFDPVEGGFHRYGTTREWTPPHYEKMLYDNAKLLRAYSHLLEITPKDDLAQEVVAKTQSYIESHWYDADEGGFYGNTDVHGEEEYYGKSPRPDDKPRVEKTKYSDWNAEAILTYLTLFEASGDAAYRDVATKSLDFFAENMIGEHGAYHFYAEDESKGVQGSLLDNAYLLLAFVEGYDTLGQERYLKSAKILADYSLENLYDWYGGGFFERNSPDTEMYAFGDNVLLEKPSEENGIIAYALLKLYQQTEEPLYLNAAIKTLGSKLGETGSLDRGYYYFKSAQVALENDLLDDFSSLTNQMEALEQEKQETFWLNALIEDTNFTLTAEGLDALNASLIVLLFIALLAGFLSFASPCSLPILPAYLAYTFKSSKQNINFFLGLSLVFTLLGLSATAIGAYLKSNLTIFSQVAGVLIFLFGLYILSGRGFSGIKIKQEKPTTYVGSFLFGGALGLSWTPCVGPILVALLLLASTTSVATGGLLLFTYSIGLALPLILVSIYLDKIKKDSTVWKIMRGKELRWKMFNKVFSIHSTTLVSGLLFVLLGYLIFSGTLSGFNQYIVATDLQKWIFVIEEWLLSLAQ